MSVNQIDELKRENLCLRQWFELIQAENERLKLAFDEHCRVIEMQKQLQVEIVQLVAKIKKLKDIVW